MKQRISKTCPANNLTSELLTEEDDPTADLHGDVGGLVPNETRTKRDRSYLTTSDSKPSTTDLQKDENQQKPKQQCLRSDRPESARPSIAAVVPFTIESPSELTSDVSDRPSPLKVFDISPEIFDQILEEVILDTKSSLKIDVEAVTLIHETAESLLSSMFNKMRKTARADNRDQVTMKDFLRVKEKSDLANPHADALALRESSTDEEEFPAPQHWRQTFKVSIPLVMLQSKKDDGLAAADVAPDWLPAEPRKENRELEFINHSKSHNRDR